MRITGIRELTVPLEGNIANAVVNFSEHTISMVAVESDAIRNGKPVTGYAFDSIGRYAQGGILRERVIPRLLAAPPESLLDPEGRRLDPAQVLRVAMCNEKPGGHGDRAAAVAAVELALLGFERQARRRTGARHDCASLRSADSTARHFSLRGGRLLLPGRWPGSAARRASRLPGDGILLVQDQDRGRALVDDLKRIEAAIDVAAGDGSRIAVDANGRFDLELALEYAAALMPYGLRWFEEIGDPLDFDLNRRVIEAYAGAVATGENLFSVPDVKNLARYGGMRPGRDVFQMDPGLSYGLIEYGRMLDVLEAHGYDRHFAHPHGGHLINLHVAVGLDIGGCEAYPGVFQPFGGYAAGCGIGGGVVRPTDASGFGLEEKESLRPLIARLAP